MGTFYSLEWAKDVVQAFQEAHPRATKVLSSNLGLSDQDLVKIARNPNSSWNNFKVTVKALERTLNCQPPGTVSTVNIASFLVSTCDWAAKHGYIRNKKVLDRVAALRETPKVPNEGFLREETTEGTQLLLDFQGVGHDRSGGSSAVQFKASIDGSASNQDGQGV